MKLIVVVALSLIALAAADKVRSPPRRARALARLWRTWPSA
jgi:hypothetical protein